jgi:hypothetical protein
MFHLYFAMLVPSTFNPAGFRSNTMGLRMREQQAVRSQIAAALLFDPVQVDIR